MTPSRYQARLLRGAGRVVFGRGAGLAAVERMICDRHTQALAALESLPIPHDVRDASLYRCPRVRGGGGVPGTAPEPPCRASASACSRRTRPGSPPGPAWRPDPRVRPGHMQ